MLSFKYLVAVLHVTFLVHGLDAVDCTSEYSREQPTTVPGAPLSNKEYTNTSGTSQITIRPPISNAAAVEGWDMRPLALIYPRSGSLFQRQVRIFPALVRHIVLILKMAGVR